MKKKQLKAFAERWGITPSQLQTLINISEFAALRQTQWHNGEVDETLTTLACDRVEKYAAKLGFKTKWSAGLYPVFEKDGLDYHLPD